MKTKCAPKLDGIGPCQRPDFNRRELHGKAIAEHAGDFALRHLAERLAKQERITDGGSVRRAVRADKGRGNLFRVPIQCLAAPAGTEKDVAERQPVVVPKPLGVGRQIGRELFFGRLRGSHVLGEKLHLLPHTPPDEEIVAVRPPPPSSR